MIIGSVSLITGPFVFFIWPVISLSIGNNLVVPFANSTLLWIGIGLTLVGILTLPVGIVQYFIHQQTQLQKTTISYILFTGFLFLLSIITILAEPDLFLLGILFFGLGIWLTVAAYKKSVLGLYL